MESNRLKLLYIASSGRSGSTVLDLLLGAHASFWTLGEFFVLPWELRTPTKPCGCGRAVEECPFWGPLVERFRSILLNGTIDRFRDSYWSGRTLRFEELGFLAARSPARRAQREAELAQYAHDNRTVLEQVLIAARQAKGPQVDWLVDASKSPYRLLWLKESGQFDVRVVHLVKDPRAFVFSICKSKNGVSRLNHIAKATVRWNVENFLFDRLFQAHFEPREILRLRYEDLAADPQSALRAISQWLGVSGDETLADKFRQENHGISGNPSRFESGGIRLDERWRTELKARTQRAVRAASFRLAGKYGFAWE